MNIYNNTSNKVSYDIVSNSSGDCGNIDPGGTAEWPAYDNSEGVYVSFGAFSTDPTPAPFTVNIPQTGVGKVVTIGLYLE